MKWIQKTRFLLATVVLCAAGALSCDLIAPVDRCAVYCDKLTQCELLGDDQTKESCVTECNEGLEEDKAPRAEECIKDNNCDGAAGCFECEDYCARIVECELGPKDACLDSCADNQANRDGPWGQSCVMEQDCDTGSRCILCDQYCTKLDDCGVATDSDCESSCETVIAGGADVSKYQCVIDEEECANIPNCGI